MIEKFKSKGRIKRQEKGAGGKVQAVRAPCLASVRP
jgi:hypothetical protein